MTTGNLQVRRATVDDLPKLIALWQLERMPWENLEKRFKEFQIIETAAGEFVGAIGVQVAGGDGRLHSEAFARQELADTARDQFWQRAHVMAGNYGLFRLWTQLPAPFWADAGFQPVTADSLAKPPAAFLGEPPPWQFLKLKEEPSQVLSIEKEFELFKEASREENERIQRQAKLLKLFATLIGVAVFVLVVIWAFTFFKVQKTAPPRF